jgi:hypothetical protein
VPVFEDIVSFVNFVRTQNVNEVWLALPLSHERTILKYVNEFRDDLVNVRFIPDVRSLALFESGVTDLLGETAINLVASPLSPSALLQKELFDRVFAACALLAVSPLLICIALAIKLTSRVWGHFCAARASTNCRNSSTCCAVTCPSLVRVRTRWSTMICTRRWYRDTSIVIGSNLALPAGHRSMAFGARRIASKKWRDASHTICITSGTGRSAST